jgi:hypothetical protein
VIHAIDLGIYEITYTGVKLNLWKLKENITDAGVPTLADFSVG